MADLPHSTTPPNEPFHILIGPKLKNALRRELHLLIEEFDFALPARRQEIARHAGLIIDLLREDDR
jgi:hypothetical protein